MDNNKFYKIGEIGKLLEIPQSTLRYWEGEFKQIRPTKSSGGQRFYTSKDIEFLKQLKEMLYVEKLTIEGAKKKLKENSKKENTEVSTENNSSVSKSFIKEELLNILDYLKNNKK